MCFFWVRRSDNSNDPARSIVRWTNEDAYMVQWWEACDGVIPSLNWIKENGSFHRCCGRNGSWNTELFDVYLWNRKKTWCFFICYVRFSWMDCFLGGIFSGWRFQTHLMPCEVKVSLRLCSAQVILFEPFPDHVPLRLPCVFVFFSLVLRGEPPRHT